MSSCQSRHRECPCPHSEPQPPRSPTFAGDPPTLTGKSDPVTYEVTAFFPGLWCTPDPVCNLQERSFCFPQSCGNPAVKPLAFIARLSGVSSLYCHTPRLGSPTWGSELSLLWENFCGIISFQFLGSPPGVCGI